MRRNRFRFSIKQHLSVFLIFCLLISQTVQVSFFDRTEAAVEDYRDIVSIIVDRETYSELSGEIKRYSEDIQGYLGDTRVSLFVVPDGTPPEAIAAQNEKLYYEGDGEDGITSLVGTVLIGNVPIPMVERDGDSFPSLFPYVDFDEKRFVYNPRAGIYQYAPNAQENTDVEIWHGVINPSVGRTWKGDTDIESIRAFLDKTHDFYTKSGKFAPSGLPPRVFYYDGYNESASINPRKLYQYSLYIANAENFAYKRFTKHLLADINAAIERYDSTEGDDELDDYIESLGYGTGSDTLDADTISTLPDIQTARPIGAFVQKFYQIVNSKVLSDSQLFVHNAGRYTSGSTVRVDQAILQATLMDEVALSMIKEGNAAMEKAIDDQITAGNYARKMIVFDKLVQTLSGVTLSNGLPYTTPTPFYKTYDGYFFGKKSSEIVSPDQCTIARGSAGTDALYRQSVRVESNAGYDVNTTQGHAEILKSDTETLVNLHKSSAYSCFDSKTGEPKIKTYWGGNSLMRVAIPGYDSSNVMNSDISSDITGYSLPIFSLGGMRETTRLKNPSLADCQTSGYQYGLLTPYTYEYIAEEGNGVQYTCKAGWPNEWNTRGYPCPDTIANRTPRYSCLTEHDVITSIPTLAETVQDYKSDTCFAGKLYVDGRNVKTGTNTCITTVGFGEDAYNEDTTKYEDRYYHSIPSLWKHISPTAEEVSAAESNGATPSLPVDIVRSFEFLTPKGNIARLEYPDFFQAPVGDRSTLRAWLKELSESQWNKIIAQENATTLTPEQIEAHSYIPATSLPASPIDWNTLISDTVLDKIIQARNWIHPDITEKTKNIIETSLSYSHQYSDDIKNNPPLLPQTGSGYDIAYLGLTSLSPLADDGDATSIENEYNTSLASIHALNMGEDGVAGPDSAYKASAQCGPPDGVMIFQWPSAIMCWVGSLLPPKISGGSCGGSTIGEDSSGPRVQTGPSAEILADTIRLQAYYAPMQLVSSFPKTVMQRRESIAVSFDYTSPDDEHIVLPTGSSISLRIQSLTASGLSIPSDRWDDYLEIAPDTSPYGDEGALFGILSKNDLIEAKLQGVLETPLPDGSIYRSVSADITLRVSDEYIDVSPMIGDTRTATIDTTTTSPVTLDFALKNASGETLPHAFPYTLDIYDTFEDILIESGITISTPEYTISPNYTKKIGTYRFALRDRFGRNGDTTLSVRSGPLARATLVPVSSALVKGSESLGILRLTDKLDNILTPELHSIDITVRGGYILDAEGQKLEKLHLDSIDSELILTYGSDSAGTLDIAVTIDGTVTTSTSLQILESARVIVERSQTPVVAGDPIQVRLKVVDSNNTLVTGFSSVALISLPEGAGYFASGESLEISDGQSQMVTFYPGRVSGDHILSLHIPGLTDVADSVFRVLPGQSMYIVPSLDDTSFSFSLRDRYGNITPESVSATLTRNTDTPKSVNFTDGILKQPRESGYYVIDAPILDSHTLTYSDTSGSYTLTGISFATLYIPPTSSEFSFLGDYNARYTVLAGGSFLSQGEDILYDVNPGESSSLAVSTLLDSPYRRESLFSIFPGGGYTLGQSSDAAMTSEISLERNTLILTVRDDVTHSQIGRVGYPIRDPELSQCIEDTVTSRTCENISDDVRVRFISLPDTDYTTTLTDDRVSLGTSELSLVSYDRSTGWTMVPGVILSPDETASLGYLVLSVELQGEIVGRILVSTDRSSSVLVSDDLTTPRPGSSVILSQTDTTFPISENYTRVFDPSVHGYTIFAPSAMDLLDENRIGPNHIDSIGSLSETPGVGWHGQNRLLLAYSAGESVGEASRYFHTYTYVNLGDPVAHVDSGAPGTEREGIDRTIGKQIASSAHGPIESYVREDMNRDGYEDIILVYSDGFLELLVNAGGKFRSKKMIAHIPDKGNRGISLGDFRGDGYGDIVTVDSSGSLILIDNDLRRLTRTPLRLSETSSLPLPSGITQFQIYDMDADTRDDIAYLTESGELGILYGTEMMGLFSQKILDSTLGVSLSPDAEVIGGALSASVVPQIDRVGAPSTGTGLDDTMLLSEVYYQRTIYDPTAPNALPSDGLLITDPALMTGTLATFLSDGSEELVPEPTRTLTYVRSEYAPAFGVEISKLYRNTSGKTLRAGDRVEVDITLKNTGTSPITDGEYLDTIPVLFDPEDTDTYTLTLSGMSEERTFQRIREDYDAVFSLMTIPVGATLHITYEVEVLPASYGEMIVSKLEGGEVGDDAYGDIGFQTSTTCGADLMLWRSEGAREYQRGTRTYTQAEIPEDIQSRITDSDGDGVPDSMEMIDSDGDGTPNDTGTSRDDLKSWLDTTSDGTNLSSDTSNLIQSNISGGNVLDIGFSDESVSEISTIVDNLSSGLKCGFGGGSCMSFPVNWAPLAPGSAPSLFGYPLGPLTPYAGFPVFSAPTTLPTPWGPIPFVWPGSPLGAGGIFGEAAPYSSKIRIFVTPTLTLGMGVAICMGTPSVDGWLPLPGVSPLVSGGKCIVMAQPMPVCKGDGSSDDGDIRGVSGLGGSTDAWNGESCSLQADTRTDEEDQAFTTSIIDYLKDKDTTRLNAIYTNLSKRGPRKVEGGLVMNIGGGGEGASTISMNFDSSKPFDLGNIINVKNIRIPAFPDFIMDWWDRQTAEVSNKLFTLPNIIIIPPTDLGPNASADGSLKSYKDVFSDMKEKANIESLQQQMSNAFGATNVTDQFNKKTTTKTNASSGYNAWLDKTVQNNSSTINSVQGSANALKAAYKQIGQIPFLDIRQSSVSVNVPWILPQELDRYSRALEQWSSEAKGLQEKWCDAKLDADCLDEQTSLNMAAFQSSIDRNIQVIQSYRDFPKKIQDYVTWRQKYTVWALCNIETIQQFTGKWVKENGVRFQKWAEFYVLMKAIVDGSWQPILDIFSDADAQCGTCVNQRYNLDYFIYKLIGSLIPTLPIIVFPKWPDIVLDLSDVRFAIAVDVPDFKFNVTPIRLPDLPSLSLPSAPTGSFTLPALPTLPAIPDLPPLPELPSLPKISLPPLPPPPKLPKVFGAISVMTNILKIFEKIKCLAQETILVPEWKVGEVIAQRTARQGTLPIDFLNFQLPQMSMPGLKEIRVQSHVNLELRSDFIAEFARTAVKPLNEFGTDLNIAIPNKIGEDLRINGPENIEGKLQGLLEETKSGTILGDMIAELEHDATVLLDTDEFSTYFRGELIANGRDVSSLDKSLAKARIESEETTAEILENHETQVRLLKQYIQAEEAKTKEIEKLIDTLKNPPPLLSGNDIPTATFVSRETDRVASALAKYDDFITDSYVIETDVGDTGYEKSLRSYQGRMARLMAASDGEGNLPESGGYAADGYTPKFEGIYILTPSGYQTRLFDYIEPLRGDEIVDVIDIDQDGDKDYLYLMDGALYLKENHTSTPSRQNDTTLIIRDIDVDAVPEAPNYFTEMVASPGEIELSFAPADMSDTAFRLEFFDRYTEWDLTRIGAHDEEDTPRTTIDLYTPDASRDAMQGGISVHPLSRALSSVSSSEGMSIYGAAVIPVLPDTSFTVSLGRPIYTGKSGSRFIYSTSSGSEYDITLKPYSRYTFDDVLSGSLVSGKIFFYDTLTSTQTPYTDDFIGMPLIEGMTLSNSQGSFSIIDTDSGEEITRESGSEYRIIELPFQSESYSLSFPYQNGFYSARLRSLSRDVSAGVTLLAPQASLDQSAPIVDLADALDIPVYQTSAYPLSDIITEMSAYTVSIDPDVAQDENTDGIYDNDFTASATGVTLTDTSLVFGPYETLGSHLMNLRVEDEYRNVTIMPLQIRVYAPIPQIETVSSSGYLMGTVAGELKNEPVHFLRIRQGTPIDIIREAPTYSQDEGVFATGTLFTGSGARFSYSGSTVNISETTGLPIGTSSLQTRVLPATSTDPMRILSLDSDDVVRFEQFLTLPSDIGIRIATGVIESPTPIVTVLERTGYMATLATITDKSIPGGVYITDSSYTPYAALARDGNIYTLKQGLTLRATTYDGYLMIEILEGEKNIADIVYQTDFFYTLK